MKQDASSPRPIPPAADATGRLLIVDDNADYLQSLGLLLEGTGHECFFCPDGPAAIDVAGNREIDLLLTDVRMTPLDGVETARAVKQLQPLVSVVMMTGFDKQDTPIDALRLGAVDYIDKPITDINGFLRSLSQHVLMAQNAKQLHRTKERLETVIQNVEAGVIVVDDAGRIEEFNDAARAWIQGQPAEAIGKPLAEVARVADLPLTIPPSGTLTSNVQLAESGGERLLQVAATRLAGPTGQSAGAVLLIKDLTALAESQKAEGWRQMSRAITHGMKTPLGTLRMRLERLQQSPPAPDWSQERDVLLRLVGELHGRLGDLVSFVRLETAQSRCDVNALVAKAVRNFEKHRAPATIIRFQPHSEPMVALCAPQSLELALENLLCNSQEAAQEQAQIDIALRRDDERNCAVIDVADNGPGIPGEVRDDVFRRPLNSTKPGGTGLGTALVKYIVDQHRGTLRWQSPIEGTNRGTRVTIELPLAE